MAENLDPETNQQLAAAADVEVERADGSGVERGGPIDDALVVDDADGVGVRLDGGALARHSALDRHQRRAGSVEAGVIHIAARLVDRALASELGRRVAVHLGARAETVDRLRRKRHKLSVFQCLNGQIYFCGTLHGSRSIEHVAAKLQTLPITTCSKLIIWREFFSLG